MDEMAEQIPVPGLEDPWWQGVDLFALTFNPYERVGSFDKVAGIANRAQKRFVENGSVPKTVDQIRTCLFFEQRRWRNFDADPYLDPDAKAYLLALLGALRDKTGGFVDGPRDLYP